MSLEPGGSECLITLLSLNEVSQSNIVSAEFFCKMGLAQKAEREFFSPKSGFGEIFLFLGQNQVLDKNMSNPSFAKKKQFALKH